MSHDEPEPSEGSETDPFDAIGREIASLLRATHDSSSRIEAEAEQRAAERLADADREATARVAEAEARVAEAEARVAEADARFAEAETRVAEADRQAAEQLAEAERHESESMRQREEAAEVLLQAQATRDQTRAEATTLLRGVLALLDAADARSSQLVEDIEGSRLDLANVRTGLAQFGATLGAVDAPSSDIGAEAPPVGVTATESAEEPAVIDLRDSDVAGAAATTTEPATETEPSSESSGASNGPAAAWSDPGAGDAQAMDDRVAASVRSAVSRAIDQCLTPSEELPPPPVAN